MDLSYRATGIPVGILDPGGTVLVAAGWQDWQGETAGVYPMSEKTSRQVRACTGSSVGGFVSNRCPNGLWEFLALLSLGGELAAILFVGQIFCEDDKPKPESLRARADFFGVHMTTYQKAMDRIPVYDRARIRDIIAYYKSLAMKMSRTLLERQDAASRCREVPPERPLEETE